MDIFVWIITVIGIVSLSILFGNEEKRGHCGKSLAECARKWEEK